MIYIHWIGILLYATITILAMLAVLMDNRQPAKTIAWLLVLSFVPIAGIVLYFFFGQNSRRERIISQQSIDLITKRSMLEFVEQDGLNVPESHKQTVNLFVNQTWALPFKDNEVEIFTSGYKFFLGVLLDIGKATRHIHIDTYIIDDDPLGNLIADALADAVKRGVEVRVIYDDVGSWKTSNSFFRKMEENGIMQKPFMPVRFPALTGKVNYRNHRKICVIDGSVGYIGGMNIAMRYIRGVKSTPWKDTHIRIKGAAVYGLQRAFLVDWYFVSQTLISDKKFYPHINIKLNNCIMQIVTSSPTSPWPEIEQGYVKILLEAKKYVYIETPYFMPTEPILFAMRTAAISGTDIRLMIPFHTDAIFAEWASRSYVRQTIEAGVKVYFYREGFNHSKLLIADDTLASCGSANVDFRSFENNFEANAFIYDRDLALKLKDVFLADIRLCDKYEDHFNTRNNNFFIRLWESLVRLLSPLM